MQNIAKQLMRGFTIFTAGSALAAACFYAYRVFLARVLEPSQYGLIFAVWALFSFVMPFRSLGFAAAFVRFVPKFREEGAWWKVKSAAVQLFVIQIGTAVFLAVLVLLFKDVLGMSYFKSAEAGPLLVAFLPFFFISVVGDTAEMVLYSFNKITLFAVKKFLDQSLLLLFTVGLFSFFPDTRIAAIAMALSALITGISLCMIAIRLLPEVFLAKWWWDREVFRQILRFGLPQMFANSGLAIFTYLDMLLLTYFRSLTDVALYAVAQPIAMLLMYFRKPLVVAFNPLASELAIKDKPKLGKVTEHIQRWMFTAIGGGGVVLFFVADTVVSVAFGDAYNGAGRIVQLLILGVPFTAVSLMDMRALFAVGSANMNARISFVTGISTTAFNLVLIPFFGVTGAALASVASGLVSFALTSYYLKRVLDVPTPYGVLLKVAICIVLAASGGFLLGLLPEMHWFIQTVMLVFGVGGIYVLSAVIVGLFTVAELITHAKRFCTLHKSES